MIKRLANKLTKKTTAKNETKTTKAVKKTTTKKTKAPAKTRKNTRKKIGSDELFALIEKKAYEFYQSRGYQHGSDQGDWFEAEKVVLAELKK